MINILLIMGLEKLVHGLRKTTVEFCGQYYITFHPESV